MDAGAKGRNNKDYSHNGFAALLSATVQQFIRDHANDDVNALLLKYREIDGVPVSVIADQITGRKKAREKIPLYYREYRTLYPPGVNLEQSSSEATAHYKSTIASQNAKNTLSCVDLTGGFGIDSLFLRQYFEVVHLVEPDANLLEITRYNHQLLGAGNIRYHNDTAEKFIAETTEGFSMIYVDPSRRDSSKRKVFTFADCSPDVTALSSKIWEKTSQLLIKASPLLDIQKALKEVDHVKDVHVVSVNNECKELLFLCEKGFTSEPVIAAINLTTDNDTFIFRLSEESASVAVFSDPLSYLYEPNASLLKSGAFKLIAKRFGLHKIATNTHFYTSKELVEGFPGKVFNIIAHVKPDAKTLAQYFPERKANISIRNYPMSVDELKKSTGLLDGGDRFLLGFSGTKKKFLLAAERVR